MKSNKVLTSILCIFLLVIIAGVIIFITPSTREKILPDNTQEYARVRQELEDEKALSSSLLGQIDEQDEINDNLINQLNHLQLEKDEIIEQRNSLQEQINGMERLSDSLSRIIEGNNLSKDVSISLWQSYYYLQLLDGNNSFITYLSKRITKTGVIYNSTELSGLTLSKLNELRLGNIHTDDTYNVNIPGFDQGSISGHHHYYQSKISSHPTNIFFNILDSQGNAFDSSSIIQMAKYRITILSLNHEVYSTIELDNTSYANRTDILKNINVSVSIELISTFDTNVSYLSYLDNSLGSSEYWTFTSEFDSHFFIQVAKNGSGIYLSMPGANCYLLADSNGTIDVLYLINGCNEIYGSLRIISPTEISFEGMKYTLQ